jgi:hypothetical protein
MVSKIKLRFTISVGEKSRVPFGTDGLMDAIARKDTILRELGFVPGKNQITALTFLAKAINAPIKSRPLKGTAMKWFFLYFIAVGFNRRTVKINEFRL